MLAYVFWHWPLPDLDASTYQHDLIAFQRTLAAHSPVGFHATRVLQMEQASWHAIQLRDASRMGSHPVPRTRSAFGKLSRGGRRSRVPAAFAGGTSWLARGETTYEDWHLVENSAALDPLNERAISGPCQEPHRLIARQAQGGTGGLYQLIEGDPHLATVNVAYRFDKPAGMTYATLYELLRPAVEQHNAVLWSRQMSLGPGPEFCLHSPAPFALPDSLPTLEIPVQQLCFTARAQG